MLTHFKEDSALENCFSYFPYFNHKLYENPSNIQEEDYSTKSDSDSQSLDDSSTNISHESINPIDDEEKLIPLNLLDLSPIKEALPIPDAPLPTPKQLFDSNDTKEKDKEKSHDKAIRPDLEKYKLPKSLFSSTKSKKNEKDEKVIFKNSTIFPSISKNLNLNCQPFVPKYKICPFIVSNNYACVPCGAKNKFGTLNFSPLNQSGYQKSNPEKKKKKKKQEFVEREGDWSCYRCKNINFSFRDKCNKCQFSKEESEKKFVEAGEALLKLADFSIYNKKSIDGSN